MKILLTGTGSEWSTERMVMRAFQDFGFEVKAIWSEDYYRIPLWNRVLNRLLPCPRYFNTRKLNEAITRSVADFKPDFVLFFKPIFIHPRTILAIRKKTKVFSWYPDYVRFPKTASVFFFHSIRYFDCHFSFNYENAEELKHLGASLSLFLPCAADPQCHVPVPVTDEERKKFGADVIFVGTYAPEKRSEYLERLCKDGYNIKIYGNGWEKLSPDSCLRQKKCIQFEAPACRSMSKVLNASKIVLAFVREHNKEYLACRTYEIPACGAFLLHERTKKTGEVFEEGKEAEFFSSYEEMKEKVDLYLKNEPLRLVVAQRGFKKVTEGGHLMKNRAQIIIDVFNRLS